MARDEVLDEHLHDPKSEPRIGVEKVVSEEGRGTVSATVRSLRSILYHEWSEGEGGREVGQIGGRGETPISFRNVNEPAATSNERSAVPFFLFASLSLALFFFFFSASRHPPAASFIPAGNTRVFPEQWRSSEDPAVACNTGAAGRRSEWCTTYPDND